MIRTVVAAALLLLSGCAGLIAAGSATGAIGGGLAVANQIAGTVNTTIDTACSAYETGRAAANAVVATGLVPSNTVGRVSIIEEYGDAACANPPSGNAVSTAIWFGTLVGQITTLTSVTAAQPQL
jgi:hypothetical protein